MNLLAAPLAFARRHPILTALLVLFLFILPGAEILIGNALASLSPFRALDKVRQTLTGYFAGVLDFKRKHPVIARVIFLVLFWPVRVLLPWVALYLIFDWWKERQSQATVVPVTDQGRTSGSAGSADNDGGFVADPTFNNNFLSYIV